MGSARPLGRPGVRSVLAAPPRAAQSPESAPAGCPWCHGSPRPRTDTCSSQHLYVLPGTPAQGQRWFIDRVCSSSGITAESGCAESGGVSTGGAPVGGCGGGQPVVLEHVVVRDLHARLHILLGEDADAHLPCSGAGAPTDQGW